MHLLPPPPPRRSTRYLASATSSSSTFVARLRGAGREPAAHGTRAGRLERREEWRVGCSCAMSIAGEGKSYTPEPPICCPTSSASHSTQERKTAPPSTPPSRLAAPSRTLPPSMFSNTSPTSSTELDPTKVTQFASRLILIPASAGLAPSSHPLLALLIVGLHASLPSPPTTNRRKGNTGGPRCSRRRDTVLPNGYRVHGIVRAELGKLLGIDEPALYASESESASGARLCLWGRAHCATPERRAATALALGTLQLTHATFSASFGVGRSLHEDIVRIVS
ncbi:hypothetical protein C8R45DRAFT_1099262 [Mycena sanguinolenta]|nr:hypothetical protein C8R45DRAFT_1099262 [Mycena sanguinolenta]